MRVLIKNFTTKVIILTIITALIGAIIFYLLPNKYFDTFPFILLIFPIVSVIIYIQLLKSSQKSLARFNVAFMLSFMIKLFVYLGLAATIISLETDNKASFVISFMVIYLIYTIFDTKFILDDIKKLDNKNEN